MPAVPPPYPDVEMGVDCPGCTPSPWPYNMTPKYLWIIYQGMQPCPDRVPPPNDIPFKLTQLATDPCEYRWSDYVGPYRFSMVYYADHSEVKLFTHHLGTGYLFLGSGPPGALHFQNTCDNCIQWRATFGGAHIYYTPEPFVTGLCEGYKLTPSQSCNYQKTFLTPAKLQVNLARPSDRTSCLVHFYTDLYEHNP